MRDESSQCRRCGTELSRGVLQGQCPVCTVRVLRESEAGAGASASPPAAPVPPPDGNGQSGHALRYLGDYELLGELGRGGMGVVYKARQLGLERTVALKLIAPEHLASPKAVERFHTEAATAAILDHPNIVPILESGECDGRHYFSMKLIEGRSLAQRLADFALRSSDSAGTADKPRVRSRQATVAGLLAKVADAVHYAHRHGILHRDLKPENILLDAAGEPHVTDFGLAKRLEADSRLTLSGEVLGTPAYMAPEQAAGRARQVTTAADVYSLGVILYELLTGRLPFRGGTSMDTLHALLHEEPKAPRSFNPAVARDLETVCLKCLEKNPAQRYASAHELAEDLRRFANGEPVQARPIGPTGKVWRWCRRKPALAGSLLLLQVVLAFGLGGILWQWRHAQRESRRAQRQAAISKSVNDFLLNDLLGQANPDVNPNRDLKLREVLDRAAQNIKDQFANQPLVEASIRFTIGSSYLGLGETETAEPYIRRALEIRKQELGPEHPDTVDALDKLGAWYRFSGRKAEAEPLLRQVSEASRKVLGAEHRTTLHRMWILAITELGLGRRAEAEELLREVLDKQQRLFGRQDKDTLRTMGALAVIYKRADRPSECAEMLEGVLSALRRTDASERGERAEVMENLGLTHLVLASYQRAAELFGRLVETQDRTGGPRDVAAQYYRHKLAMAYGGLGAWALCVQTCREVAASTNGASRPYAHDCEQYGATAALMAGDASAYREFAGRLLARCAGTTNASTARMAAQICLLAPDALTDITPAFKLAEMLPAGRPGLNGNKLAKAMAQYRLGHLADALEYCEGWRRSDSLATSSLAGLVSAMAYQGQGNTAQAQADLAEAGNRVVSFLRTGELDACGDFNFGWSVLRAAFLRAEAERLILGRGVSPRIDGAWLEAARDHWRPIRHRLDQAGRLAGHRQWAQARDEYLAVLADAGFEWEAAYGHDYRLPAKMGITFLLAGDPASCQQICRQFLARLENYDDRVTVADLVPVCLACKTNLLGGLAPKVVDRAQALEPDPSFHGGAISLYHMMSAYRSGQYQKVIDEPKAAEGSDFLAVRSAARIYCAMALGRLGRVAEGKKELAQAQAQVAPHLATMTGDYWCDLALCQLALDEAHRRFAEARNR